MATVPPSYCLRPSNGQASESKKRWLRYTPQCQRRPPNLRYRNALPPSPFAPVFESGEGAGVLGCFRFAIRANPSHTPPHLNHGGFWAGRGGTTRAAQKHPYLITRGSGAARPSAPRGWSLSSRARPALSAPQGSFARSQTDEVTVSAGTERHRSSQERK